MKPRVATLLATVFGAGFAPRAPGTVGSLTALPCFWALGFAPAIALPFAILAICLVGVWSAQKVADATGLKDPQIVVIDELAGALIALALAGEPNLWRAIAAVAAFRLFDIWKPWPISALERLSPAGLGVMADDIAAGIVAGLLIRLIPL